MVIPTREFGQVLGDGMNSLARTWRVLLPTTLAISVPASIASIITFSLIDGATDFLDVVLNTPAQLQSLAPEVIWEMMQPFYLAVAITTGIQLLTGLLIALVGHRAVADEVAGHVAPAANTARRAIVRYPTALLAVVITLVAVAGLISLGVVFWLTPMMTVGTPNPASVLVALLLFIALIGPGIWVGVAISMTTPVVAIERLSAIASILRSVRLVRGRWWATAGFLLIVGLLGGIAIQMIQLLAFPLVMLGDASGVFVIAAGLGVFAQGVFVAAISAMTTQWYLDLRSRREPVARSDLGSS